MKKIKIPNLLIFLIGLSFLSLGIVLVVKSNLGISVATSVPYVFSLYFTKISFGKWNYIIHGSVLILLVLVVKRLTVKHLMSFGVAFLFGETIDLFNILLKDLEASTILSRLILFALGSITISIGVAGFMKSNFPILPFDTFVKEVTLEKNIKYSKFKTYFDLTCLSISLAFSLLFFRAIKGINIGTFISAFILGSMIGKCINLMDKYLDGQVIFPIEKTDKIMNYYIINLNKVVLVK